MIGKRPTALQLWGKELARARELAHMSGTELANQTYLSKQTISMWENGHRVPQREDLERCEKVLGTNGYLGRLLTDWVSREVSSEWMDKWQLIEAEATTLLSFQPTVLPGLLQTEDYARAVLHAGRYHLTNVEGMVASRMERQKILYEPEDPPIFVAVIAESVLLQQAGDDVVMRGQMIRLIEMLGQDNVFVQVVPLDSPVGSGFLSPFVVANLDGGKEVAYVDNQLTGEVVERPDNVATLRRTFELFRGAALSARESTELIVRMEERWKN